MVGGFWRQIAAGTCAAAWVVVLLVLFRYVNRRIDVGHSGDFRHFYFASRALLAHEDPYADGTGALAADAPTPAAGFRAGTHGYLYPPLVAVLYAPVAGMRYESAERVVLAVDLVLAAGGILLVAATVVRRLDLPRSAAVFWGVVLLGTLLDVDKVRAELQMFQTNALMFALFALSLWWLDRRPWLAGGPLGVILNIKYLSLGLLPWLVVRRRWGTAAATVASAAVIAVLPAFVSGWHANLRHLGVAFGGLSEMVGRHSGAEQANVDDITSWFSCSFTSTAARLGKFGVIPAAAWRPTVVAFAALCVGAVTAMYRRRRVPVFAWPPASLQDVQPWRAMAGLEFAAVVIATLCFSPQTNTRHLFLSLLLTIPMAGLILAARPAVPRVPLGIAAAFLFLTFVLPPGNRYTEAHHWQDLWLGVGGPCWGLLVAVLATLSAGLCHATDAAAAVPGRAVPGGFPVAVSTAAGG